MKGQVVSWDCGALNFALRARARTSHTAREIREMSSEPKMFVSRSGGAGEQEPDDRGKFVVELNVAYGDKQDDGGNGLVESAGWARVSRRHFRHRCTMLFPGPRGLVEAVEPPLDDLLVAADGTG
jgi:hypothetical protein